MSHIFYDHLIILEEVEIEVKNIASSSEEREELWKLIDEIIHHRVLESIFDILPREHHEEFLTKFHEAPYHEELFNYLKEKTQQDVEKVLSEKIQALEKEILKEIKG
ncbi:hypothetical protein A2714_04705 [Candidatus Woesebacteria bacterium RIFCSPHIGHO2_01_FULL_38_9]|uniref:Uncharacterized protein n=2 Tax=Candidatus Woeseibacteriota TaxID=1752722 RepID=A0A1F7Y0Y0_9BACT|nr:MAG: hypothetical protein A2714_04705 [Candidatus Woesebacteria bacterium RIFCSPHIGHO2_01_FULL_38_9]OGM58847.1 MAG: hypothetical protein A3A75_06305 [Candidatus Woesebacteria bacterium RIFCSPLOWO2_01_FULL_39_10]